MGPEDIPHERYNTQYIEISVHSSLPTLFFRLSIIQYVLVLEGIERASYHEIRWIVMRIPFYEARDTFCILFSLSWFPSNPEDFRDIRRD